MLDSEPMRHSSPPRFFPAAVAGLLLAVVVPVPAWTAAALQADPPAAGAKAPPEVDPARVERIVRENLANIREVRDGLAPSIRSVSTAWVGIEAILRARARYMAELGQAVALTRHGGVLALDRLDNAASDALGYLLTLFLEKEAAEPPPAAKRAFQEASKNVPASPPVPIGFIVLTRADGLAVAALNAIRANPTVPALEIKRAAIRTLSVDLASYFDATTSEGKLQVTMEATADYTARRIRCPYDGSEYTIVGRRTGVKADESLYRRLVCRCNTCKREVKLDFDYPDVMPTPLSGSGGGAPDSTGRP